MLGVEEQPPLVKSTSNLEQGPPGKTRGPAVRVDASLIPQPVDQPSLGEILVEGCEMIVRDPRTQRVERPPAYTIKIAN